MTDDLVKQPALRKWQESVHGKGPYQVPDYESMAAIVQEHEQMADRIEELQGKLAKEKAVAFRLGMETALKVIASIGYGKNEDVDCGHGEAFAAVEGYLAGWKADTPAELKGETDG